MTPDIQELKRLAEAADEALRTADGHRTQTEEAFLYLYRDAASPDTILALIEVVRAAEALVDVMGPQIWKTRQTRLRTALGGVKK